MTRRVEAAGTGHLRAKLRKPLPEFRTERDIQRFFADPDLDLSQYDLENWGETVHVAIGERARFEAELRRRGNLVPVGIRMSRPALRRIKALAARKGIGYQPLIRMWIHERLAQEIWWKSGAPRGMKP